MAVAGYAMTALFLLDNCCVFERVRVSLRPPVLRDHPLKGFFPTVIMFCFMLQVRGVSGSEHCDIVIELMWMVSLN